MLPAILFVCASGISTSLLVAKMQRVIDSNKYRVDVVAKSVVDTEEFLFKHEVKLVLLSPQVRHLLPKYQELLTIRNIPVQVICMRDYGLLDGEKIMREALKFLK